MHGQKWTTYYQQVLLVVIINFAVTSSNYKCNSTLSHATNKRKIQRFMNATDY